MAEKGKHNATAASDPSSFKTPAAPKAVPRVDTAAAIAPGDTAAANGDSPSLTIKLLEPVSTGNKPKGAMGPPAPVGGKTPAAFKTPAPHVSEQVRSGAVNVQQYVASVLLWCFGSSIIVLHRSLVYSAYPGMFAPHA